MSIRWGMIGCGDVTHVKSGPALYLAERSELTGVTSRTTSKAVAFAKAHGNPVVYETSEQLLACPDIDAVYIATPPNDHTELTLLSAAAGKHVLCEKPLAMSVDDCHRMITCAREHGVSLCVAYYRRYFPVVQKIKDLLDQGAIGTPLRVNANTYSMFRSNEPEPWRLNPQISGGGFLMDVGCHRFDLMAFLFGTPMRVKALLGSQTLGASVEDAASVAAEFGQGVLATASFHWNCPIDRDDFQIVGSEGMLSTDNLNHGRLVLERTEGNELWELPAKNPVHLNLVQAYVDHLLDGAPNPLPGEDGLVASKIIEQIYCDQLDV